MMAGITSVEEMNNRAGPMKIQARDFTSTRARPDTSGNAVLPASAPANRPATPKPIRASGSVPRPSVGTPKAPMIHPTSPKANAGLIGLRRRTVAMAAPIPANTTGTAMRGTISIAGW